MLHLFLGGTAIADDGLLDFACGIFINRDLAVHTGTDRRTARLTQLQGRIGIFVHKHTFDGHFLRQVLLDDGADTRKDNTQPLGQRVAAGADTTAGDIADLLTGLIDNAVSRYPGTGVNAEDAGHGV